MKFVRGKARLPMAFVFAILMCVVCGGNAVFAESILGSPRITSLDDEYYGTIGENEITDGDSITLKWSSVTNATGYNWYIKQLRGTPDPTNNNESAVNSWTGSTGTSSTSRKHTLRGSNVSAGYWYKFVVEATASGYTSGWSDWVYVYVDEATLGDVVISGLTDEYAGTVGSNGITAGSGITFRWSASENATQYTWYIKQLSGTPDPTDDNEPYVSGGYWHGTTGTSSSSRTCTLKGDDVVAGYWYKFVVKASASGYMDRWSNWVYCYVAPGSLAKAKVVSPSAWDELTAGSSILFDWDPVPGAKKYHYYIKQLSGEPDTSNDNEPCVASWDAEVGSSTTKYTLSGTNVKSGYWYKFVVSAISNAQNVSWSEWRYVYIQENAPLDRPKITSPLSGESYDAGNDIVFTWDKVSGAASYAYYIKQLEGEPDFSDNEKAVNLWSGTTKASVRRYVLDGDHIQPNTWYKFVVEARADGCVSGWSYYTYIKIPKNENWIEVTAPKNLQNVESEAYNGNKRLRVYDASQSSLVSIDGKAFYNCTNLIAVKLPATVASIASDAFSGCSNLTIYCPAGSEAERFAKAHGIRTEIYGIVVEKDLLTLSANNWVIGSENAANKVVSVSSTGTWKAVSSKSWLTVSAASGTNGESVVLTASENTGSSERNAKVTFTSGSATAVVSVNQSGAQSSVVTPVVAGSWTDPSTITVTLGDQYRLNGSVSVSNGKLGVVSVSVANGSNQALTNNYDGMVSGISLASESAFVIDTARDSDFAKAGTYSLALYAKAYGSNNAVKIGERTLVIKSPMVERTPVVSATLTTDKVYNSGSGKLGVTVTTTYADRFYIEVLNGNTPISISDQWKGTVKKREYNGDDFAVPTLYTAAGKSWGPVYITIPQGTAAGEYSVRVTAQNDQNSTTSAATRPVTIEAEPLDTDIRIDDCKLTAYTVKAGGMVCVKLKANNAHYFSAEIDGGISKVNNNFLGGVGVKNRMASILIPVPSDMSAGTHTVKVVCSTPGQNDVVKTLNFIVARDLETELAWPISAKTVNSHFGERYASDTPGASTNHKGIDIPAVGGTPIYVPADGVVKVSGLNGSYGYYVKIEHANGISSFYGHMREASKLIVGSAVRKGDLIGYVGGTGLGGKIAYGNHLHFGVLRNGTDVDPLSGYVDRTGISYSIQFYQYP